MNTLSSDTRLKPFNVAEIRKDFPILSRTVNGQPLIYLDNAASSQKPNQVLEAMDHYYQHTHANVHRGVHQLSQEATDLFELSRRTIASFIGAPPRLKSFLQKGQLNQSILLPIHLVFLN